MDSYKNLFFYFFFILLISGIGIRLVRSQYTNMFWSPELNFGYPTYGTYLTFDDWAYIDSFDLYDDRITFNNLALAQNTGISFGISLLDCNATVTNSGEFALILLTYGIDSTTGTILIYCGSLGEPTVLGATSSSYNSISHIETITSFFPNPNHIIINWANELPFDFNLLLFILGFFMLVLPLFIIFWQKPKISRIILLLFVSLIGWALLTSLGA